MEADWTVALAPGDPIVAVPWAGPEDKIRSFKFVDLRLGAHQVDEIEEARSTPALRSALLVLNADTSPLWTAKCDAWTSSVDEGAEPFDPYEMDADPGEVAFGAGSYVDLLPRDVGFRAGFERQEHWIRAVTEVLRSTPASAARVELVLRRAEVEGASGFAVTWFVEGCGSTAQRAGQRWAEALDLALAVVMDVRLMVPGRARDNDTMAATGE
jgi:hypothetical protein